jgi:hypothetical protein
MILHSVGGVKGNITFGDNINQALRKRLATIDALVEYILSADRDDLTSVIVFPIQVESLLIGAQEFANLR